MMTYQDTMDYRVGLKEMAVELKPTCMITLQFNKDEPTSYTYAADRLRHFHGRLDRYLLGPRWAAFPSNRRSHSIAVPQGHNCSDRTDSEYLYDFHFHVLLAPAPFPKMELSAPDVENLARRIWTGLVPAGDVCLDDNVYDAGGAMDYCSRLMAGGSSTSIEIAHNGVSTSLR